MLRKRKRYNLVWSRESRDQSLKTKDNHAFVSLSVVEDPHAVFRKII